VIYGANFARPVLLAFTIMLIAAGIVTGCVALAARFAFAEDDLIELLCAQHGTALPP
jgi:hypothetical protein